MKLTHQETALFRNKIGTFSHLKVLVLGDIMLDEYIWGKVSRISPEAPVPIADVEQMTHVPGGSANVAHNLHTLGATVYLGGAIGEDSSGKKLLAKLKGLGLNTSLVILDHHKPTTLKSRIVAHSQHVIRVDREDRSPTHDQVLHQLLKHASSLIPKVDAVLLSDYNKGILTPSFTQSILRKAKQAKKWISVDPKGTNYAKYRGASMITPNLQEAELISKLSIHSLPTLKKAGALLLKTTGIPHVLITQGKDGMTLFEKNGNSTHVPATATEVYDITGAGDTAISTLTLGVASGLPPVAAMKLANLAAGLVVQKVGTSTLTGEELLQAVTHHE